MLENRNVQANEPLVQVVNWLIGNVDMLCRVSHRLWNLAGLKPENLGKRMRWHNMEHGGAFAK